MNDCYHIATSPGQSMCLCEDRRMHLELMIELLCAELVSMKRRLDKQAIKYMEAPDGHL